MANVALVIYLLIVIALIAVILLQRSEGGGLGMGGGGNSSGGLVSARGSANLLTRTTAILAGLFMMLAIGLTVIQDIERPNDSILDSAADGGETNLTVLDALNDLQPATDSDLALPGADAAATSDAPAADIATPTEAPAAETPATEAPAADAATTDANADLAAPNQTPPASSN